VSDVRALGTSLRENDLNFVVVAESEYIDHSKCVCFKCVHQ
jgi:hypothetical protein